MTWYDTGRGSLQAVDILQSVVNIIIGRPIQGEVTVAMEMDCRVRHSWRILAAVGEAVFRPAARERTGKTVTRIAIRPAKPSYRHLTTFYPIKSSPFGAIPQHEDEIVPAFV